MFVHSPTSRQACDRHTLRGHRHEASTQPEPFLNTSVVDRALFSTPSTNYTLGSSTRLLKPFLQYGCLHLSGLLRPSLVPNPEFHQEVQENKWVPERGWRSKGEQTCPRPGLDRGRMQDSPSSQPHRSHSGLPEPRAQRAWHSHSRLCIQNPPLPPTSYVTTGQLLNFSVLCSPVGPS